MVNIHLQEVTMEKEEKTVTIRMTQEEYAQLREIAKAESRFPSRQAAYWVKHGIRAYLSARSGEE